MATSDLKMKEIETNEAALAVINEYMDNLPTKDPKNWKMVKGMNIKQMFKYLSEEEFPQEKREAMIAALDAVEM